MVAPKKSTTTKKCSCFTATVSSAKLGALHLHMRFTAITLLAQAVENERIF
jgi:hypothetical protein